MTTLTLADEHRLDQLALRANLLQGLLGLWPILDRDRLDATFAEWSEAVHDLVGQHHTLSAVVASRYIGDVRAQVGVETTAPPVPVPDLPADQLQAALAVTALIQQKRALVKGKPADAAGDDAFVNSAGVGTLFALKGGRDTIVETVEVDAKAIGWARISDELPCYFCAALISRGPVYKSETSAGFVAHPHCGCQPAPVYSRSDPVVTESKPYSALWNRTTRGLKGKAAMNAFRRAYTS